MIYSLSGKLAAKRENFVVVDVGGVHYKAFITPRAQQNLPAIASPIHLYSHLHVREDLLDLYGFLNESELLFFEKLISVSGVGPKSALAVMAVASVEQLAAAINEGKPDLLMRASGIGRKIAERVILELKGKLAVLQSAETIKLMESNLDLEEALIGLGYARPQVKKAIAQIDPKTTGLEQRLKEVLKKLKND